MKVADPKALLQMDAATLRAATRKELIAYLEAWGYQCYAHETTAVLRRAALLNFKTEGE